MKRVLTVLAAALVLVAIVAVTATPAFAVRRLPPPRPIHPPPVRHVSCEDQYLAVHPDATRQEAAQACHGPG
jgi:hypothetical protein